MPDRAACFLSPEPGWFMVDRVKEHRLRSLSEHDGANGHIVVAKCTCGWVGSACFHSRENALNEHRIHAMGHIDGSETITCCFCGNVIPARLAIRLYADQYNELRYLCVDCQEPATPAPAPTPPAEHLEGVRDDLIALERELRAC